MQRRAICLRQLSFLFYTSLSNARLLVETYMANNGFLLLWYCARKPSLPEQDDSSARHITVQWPQYDINRQQYMVIGELR